MKKVIESYILFLFIIFIIFIYINNADSSMNYNPFVIVTFIINGCIIICGILKDKYKFSLNKIFWYFSLFFLFIAPLFQYMSGYNVWNFKLNDNNYILTNTFLNLWFLIYFVTYYLYIKKTKKRDEKEKIAIRYTDKAFFFLTILSIISIILAIILIGFKNLFIRDNNDINFNNEIINMVLNNSIRIIPVFALVYSYFFQNCKKNILLFSILFILLIICLNFPLSRSRYWVGAIYIGLLVIIMKEKMSNRAFDYGLIFIFAIVFPIFQLFKWYGIRDIYTGNAIKDLFTVYNNVDFDAYSMFARTIVYVENHAITYGNQVFSTVLFFVPRAIWKSKSIPSGELVATFQGQHYTNVSSPLPAEGYINFGVIGIIIYAIVFALLIKKVDNNYWKKRDQIYLIDFTYPFALGFEIFLLRGSFHPAVIYIISFYLFVIIYYFYVKVFKKRIKINAKFRY